MLQPESRPEPPPGDRVRRRFRSLPTILLSVGLIVFSLLSIACWMVYDDSEQQLAQERTEEAAAVLSVSVSQIRAPLDSAAMLAAVTDGDPTSFEMAFQELIGDTGSFNSAALYRVGSEQPVATIGEPITSTDGGPASLPALLAATSEEPFVVVDLLTSGSRRLGYAVADDQQQPRYIVYAERVLSADPNVRQRTDAPFADLDYAIYLGTEERPEALIGSSVADLPLEGRRGTTTTPFGDQQLLLVMTPIGHLTSWLLANLWWMVALLGALLSITTSWLVSRLHARSSEAIGLAQENARLYDEQRHIAETLQLSLLPQVLESPAGSEVAARYWPAGTAALIGGDFYDAFKVDDSRWAVVIGDVCGKGVEAAAITGLARHTVRAAARNAGSASDVLQHLHRALVDHQPSTFCTVCFLFVVPGGDGCYQLTISLAGHPPPLLRAADGTVTEVGEPGQLLGIFEPLLSDTAVTVHRGDTLVLYTDGLTDAPPGQAVPLSELIELLEQQGDEPTEQLADSIRPLKRRRRPRGSSDDTVIMVVRF